MTDVYLFVYLFIYLYLCVFIYVYVTNDTSESSQGIIYIYI